MRLEGDDPEGRTEPRRRGMGERQHRLVAEMDAVEVAHGDRRAAVVGAEPAIVLIALHASAIAHARGAFKRRRRPAAPQSNLRLGASTSASPSSTTVSPTRQRQSSVTRRRPWSISRTVDRRLHPVPRAAPAPGTSGSARGRPTRGREAARRSPPRSGPRSASRGRSAPRRSCPAHRRRRGGPGLWSVEISAKARISASPIVLESDRDMPISISSMQIVPTGRLCSRMSNIAFPESRRRSCCAAA